LGLGLAPIGHTVTVAGVSAVSVNTVIQITYENGWSWADVEPYAIEALDAYFKELAASWADANTLIVRISQIETRFLDLPGVMDVGNTALNGATQNLTLGVNEIPIRGNTSGQTTD
jgi:hypothetical protein